MNEHLIAETDTRNRKFRMRYSALIQRKLQDASQPIVKTAETPQEVEEALSLVYREYLRMGYIRKTNGSKIYASIYHLLPQTSIIVCKFQQKIIGTLTQIFDTRIFGLPSDCLYNDELWDLRKSGRKIIEISALAIRRENRNQNAFVYLFQAVYQSTKLWNADDLCIMVNPKHVEFYKAILLFEELGPERYYSRVRAPAVALRLNLNNIEERLKENYRGLGIDNNNWYSFLCLQDHDHVADCYSSDDRVLDDDTIRHLFVEKSNVFKKAPPEQQNYLRGIYRCL